MNPPDQSDDVPLLDPLDRKLLEIDERLEHQSEGLAHTPRISADPTVASDLVRNTSPAVPVDKLAEQCLQWIEAIRVTAPDELEGVFRNQQDTTRMPPHSPRPVARAGMGVSGSDGSRDKISTAENRIGRFELIHELGRGGYGIVFLRAIPRCSARSR